MRDSSNFERLGGIGPRCRGTDGPSAGAFGDKEGVAKLSDAGELDNSVPSILRRVVDDLLLETECFSFKLVWVGDTTV